LESSLQQDYTPLVVTQLEMGWSRMESTKFHEALSEQDFTIRPVISGRNQRLSWRWRSWQ